MHCNETTKLSHREEENNKSGRNNVEIDHNYKCQYLLNACADAGFQAGKRGQSCMSKIHDVIMFGNKGLLLF